MKNIFWYEQGLFCSGKPGGNPGKSGTDPTGAHGGGVGGGKSKGFGPDPGHTSGAGGKAGAPGGPGSRPGGNTAYSARRNLPRTASGRKNPTYNSSGKQHAKPGYVKDKRKQTFKSPAISSLAAAAKSNKKIHSDWTKMASSRTGSAAGSAAHKKEMAHLLKVYNGRRGVGKRVAPTGTKAKPAPAPKKAAPAAKKKVIRTGPHVRKPTPKRTVPVDKRPAVRAVKKVLGKPIPRPTTTTRRTPTRRGPGAGK